MSSGVNERVVQLSLPDYPAMGGNVALAYEREQFHLVSPAAADWTHGGQRIDSERRLARLACLLGAPDYGGPLSSGEQRVVAEAQGESIAPYLVEAARQAICEGGDPLGDALCALRPAIERRVDGAFYTPSAIVEAMAAWLLTHSLSRVVDPGCGSGRFAAAVARKQPDLPIIAVDTDPLATLLTRAVLAAIGARNARVVQHDYLTFALPHDPGRAGYIANPPYIRHHDLPAAAKEWAVAAGKRLGVSVSGLSGLHALFYLATALSARPGDVGCFITSAEWLDTGYGAVIRRLLVDKLGLQTLNVFDARAIPFADAMTTAAITTFVVGTRDEHVTIDAVDTMGSLDLGVVKRTVERGRLTDARRWSPLLRHDDPPPDNSALAPLRTVARVHRGVATGSNSFFVLTREHAERLGLAPWCRPVITRAEEILSAGGVIHDTPQRRLLLAVPADVDRRAYPALDAYLTWGEQAHDGKPPVAHGYLASRRKPWWYLGPVAAPPIVASYMARQAPAFAYNPDGLVLLNVAHGIHPRQPLDDTRVRGLARQLNDARATFRGHGRTYHGGLEKFEPHEMENLLINLKELEHVLVLY